MKNTTLSGSLLKRNAIANFVVINRKTIIEIISALFILLFAYTAINKFIDLKDLKYVLKHYPLIGNFPQAIAWGLPIVESLIALLLFFPRAKLLGLWSSLIMMVTFTVYLTYMLIFTPNLPCTCGGMLQKLSWPQHLLFNVLFVLLAIAGIWMYRKSQDKGAEPNPTSIVFT